jgi:hypothetical protein
MQSRHKQVPEDREKEKENSSSICTAEIIYLMKDSSHTIYYLNVKVPKYKCDLVYTNFKFTKVFRST